MSRHGAALCWILAASTSAAALQSTLDRRAIEEAIFIGRSPRENERRRFHSTYRLDSARPPVDWIDIVTPFHRVAMAAENAARSGLRRFGQREALQVLNESPGRVDLLVEMTFHPLNAFVGVPDYDVSLLGQEGSRIEPLHIARFPRSGRRVEVFGPRIPVPAPPSPGDGQPVLGGTLVAAFDNGMLDPTGRYEAVVADGVTELARLRFDLSLMR